MKIFALKTKNDEFNLLMRDIAPIVPVQTFDSADALSLALDDCDAILLDLDTDTRTMDKLIKKIRKADPELPIFVLCNKLDPKKLAKHQNTKHAPDLYFRYPTDDEVIKIMLSEYFDPENAGDELNDKESQLVAEHEAVSEMSPATNKLSEKLDSAFSDAFPDEFEDMEHEKVVASETEVETVEAVESEPQEFDLGADDEFDLGDDEEFSLGDDVIEGEEIEEFDLGGKDDNSLVDLGSEPEAEQVEPTAVEATGEFDLGGEEEVVDDLSLDSEEEDMKDEDDALMLDTDDEGEPETQLPSSEDLEFPDLSASTSDDLSLSDFDLSSNEEDSELVLGEGTGTAMDLSSQDEPAAELKLDDATATVMDLSASDDSTDDNSNELKLDDATATVMDLSADSSEILSEAQGLTLDDSPSADSSESGLIDLSKDEVPEMDLSNANLNENIEDLNTNTELADQLGDELSLSIETTPEAEVKEVTEPGLNLEEDIQFGSGADSDATNPEAEKSLEFNVSDSLEVDDKDSDGGSSDTATGIQVDDISFSGTEINDLLGSEQPLEVERKELPKEETLEQAKADEVDSFMASEDTTLASEHSFVSEEEEADDSLSADDLPQSPPDFTTTIQRKMEEIDALIEDEDATVVAQLPDELTRETSINEPDADEEATIIQEIPEDLTKPQVHMAKDEDVTQVSEEEKMIQELEDEKEDVVVEKPAPSANTVTYVSEDQKVEYREYIQNRDEELMRLSETIKSLRTDREDLLNKISEFEAKEGEEKRDFLSVKAELDEKKIEVEILKKRYLKEIDDLKFRLDLASDKKDVLAAKNKQYESEFEKVRREKKLDINKIRARERELEEKLDLLKRDAEIQIRTRDQKILDLKRRIDTLEFDIESAHIRERKKSSDQQLLEDRMSKVIKTLRGVIGQLEDDNTDDRKKLIKKNLDV